MIYNRLEKTIYLKSRYELMALLENIEPVKGNVFEGISLSSDITNLCEEKINTWFPHIPFSEERLALFSHIVSNSGIVKPDLQHALNSGNRAQAWFAMRYRQANNDNSTHDSIKRCMYEAEIFGLFDNLNEVTETEIESVTDFLNSNYKHNLTYWHYILNSENDYCHPLCIYQFRKLIERKTEKQVIKSCLAKNIFLPLKKIYCNEAIVSGF